GWCHVRRRPGGCTLLPYTTLFRSAQGPAGQGEEDVVQGRAHHLDGLQLHADAFEFAHQTGHRSPGAGDPAAHVLTGDLDAGVGDGVQRHSGIGDPVGGGHFEVHQVAGHGGLEVVGGVGGDDAPAVDDDDPIAERVGLIKVVGGQEHGGTAFFAQCADVVPQVHPRLGVQTGGGLVQEHQVRVVDEAHGDVQATSLPA